MRKTITLAAMLLIAGTAWASSYVSDFEGDTLGALPTGWTTAGWGDWAPGPINAGVAAAPGGGQALKVDWGTDWANYGASSGEADLTLDMTGIDGGNALLTISYDFYKINWRVWQAFGDQSWFPPGGIHMNDDPAKPNEGEIGTDDYGNAAYHLTGIPENAWIHVQTTFNSGTDAWQTSMTWNGGGGTFSGTNANAIAGQYFWGGWAFKVTMDAAPAVPYTNALYLDNISFSVVPEPAGLALLAVGLLLRRR